METQSAEGAAASVGQTRAVARPSLARSIHELSAAANDASAPASFSHLGVLNVPSEDDLAEMIADWTAVIDPEEDQIQRLRHGVVNADPEADSNYLRLSYFKVNPGHSGDLVKMHKSYWALLKEYEIE